MLSAAPILPFGTGRFLQAHVYLFVSQALPRGQALGGIAVVQSTDSAQSSTRLAALAGASGYTVRLRDLHDGRPVDEEVQVSSVHAAWHAGRDWPRLLNAMATQVQVIVSNTADKGMRSTRPTPRRCWPRRRRCRAASRPGSPCCCCTAGVTFRRRRRRCSPAN